MTVPAGLLSVPVKNEAQPLRPFRNRHTALHPDTPGSDGRRMAGVTGLEPATSGVTGQHSNQLSYTPDGALP